MGDLVDDGPQQAIEKRSNNFEDLVFMHKKEKIELAIEAEIPKEILKDTDLSYDMIRYEISVGFQEDINEVGIYDERVLLKNKSIRISEQPVNYQTSVFPGRKQVPDTILSNLHSKETRTIVSKKFGANDNFYSEVYPKSGKGWAPSCMLGQKISSQ